MLQLLYICPEQQGPGYKLICKHQRQPGCVQRNVLLKAVNRRIFSPESFKWYCKVFARSTGVVQLSRIKLPTTQTGSLDSSLACMEFCLKTTVLLRWWQMTGDQETSQPSRTNSEAFYLFPALIRIEIHHLKCGIQTPRWHFNVAGSTDVPSTISS